MEQPDMDENLEAAARGIFARAKAIILTPKDEWPKIESESKPQAAILKTYVIPLTAIGPIALFIGRVVFGFDAGIVTIHYPLVGSIIAAVVSFAIVIAGVFVTAYLADMLATNFGGTANKANAFKLAAYGMTAWWLSGIFFILPQLWFFTILGAYSIFLLYTGVTPLMKVPEDKAIGYTAVLVICAGIILAISSSITNRIATPSLSSMSISANAIKLPGGGTFDTSKVGAMSQQLESATNGKTQPVDAAKMQALLPQAIGSYQRTATESTGMGAIGSEADGTYTAGENSFHLKITDMSALGAIAGLGSAMGVSNNREDANGYERTGTVNGQMQTESWNKTDGRGKYSVIVGNRFMIEAEGKTASVDELKAAVATVDQGNLLGFVG
jgi:hypothetical protein